MNRGRSHVQTHFSASPLAYGRGPAFARAGRWVRGRCELDSHPDAHSDSNANSDPHPNANANADPASNSHTNPNAVIVVHHQRIQPLYWSVAAWRDHAMGGGL